MKKLFPILVALSAFAAFFTFAELAGKDYRGVSRGRDLRP